MERKSQVDLFGAVSLIAFSLLLGFNQVVIKVTGEGFSPAFAVGLRSLGAVICLLVWMWFRGISLKIPRDAWFGGILSGVIFSVEFMLLYKALDITTVSRASVIFYTMPVWLALAAHFFFPGERLTRFKVAGLVLATSGVGLAMMDRGGGAVSWLGDLLAFGAAICWAGIILCIRLTPLAKVPAAQQLFLQIAISAPLMLIIAPFFGPLTRDLEPIHFIGLAYQIVAVASFGYLFWFWLLQIYPASSVASFSFLSPVFAVLLGWLILSEEIAPSVWAALVLVATGIYLVNRKPRSL